MNSQKYHALDRGRECKFSSAALGEVAEDGTFSGYASLFGRTDLGNDVVVRGAFAKSIAARSPAGIRMLFQHNPDKPIGVWEEVREDANGLFVRGRITRDVSNGAEVLSLMRSGALDGLSIGFKTKRSRTDKKTGIREILEADLWEISVVTFPMLPDARVTQVKQSQNNLPTIREFERWLTRDAGLTRGQAKTVIAKGFTTLAGRRDAVGISNRALAEKIRQATRTIKNRKTQ